MMMMDGISIKFNSLSMAFKALHYVALTRLCSPTHCLSIHMVYPSLVKLLKILMCASFWGWASCLSSLLYLIWYGHVFSLKSGSSVPQLPKVFPPLCHKALWANFCCHQIWFYCLLHSSLYYSQLRLWVPVKFASESPVASRRCLSKIIHGCTCITLVAPLQWVLPLLN